MVISIDKWFNSTDEKGNSKPMLRDAFGDYPLSWFSLDYFALLPSNFLKPTWMTRSDRKEPPPARRPLEKSINYFIPFLLVSNWEVKRKLEILVETSVRFSA